MTFGEKLRSLRKEKGLSQTALAEMVGTTKRTILCYENGAFYPRDRETYKKLADALGCDELYLKSEDSEPTLNRLKAYAQALEQVRVKNSANNTALPSIEVTSIPDDEETMRRFRSYMLQFIMTDTKLTDDTKAELCERVKTWQPAR